MHPPRRGAVVASSVFAGFGVALVCAGIARPGPPPVGPATRWVTAEAFVRPAAGPASPAGSSGWSPATAPPEGQDDPARTAGPDDQDAVPVPAPRDAPTTPGEGTGDGGSTVPSPQAPVAEPVSLEIPRIGVRAPLGGVGRDAAGAIAVPAPGRDASDRAYWYRGLARPGAPGPAVLVGHVDSRVGGPAVFYRLGELVPGDVVTVHRADGTAARFAVRALGRYPKATFPAATVYASTPGPSLRLITCGGGFDSRHGSYLDNVVVFADAVG